MTPAAAPAAARRDPRWPAFAALAALLTGCAGGTRSGSSSPSVASAPAGSITTPDADTGAAVPGADDGLEVRSWSADDRAGQVGLTLARLAAEVGVDADDAMPPDIRRRWEANGLRWVRLPDTRLGELERALPPVRLREASWVGWSTTWSEIFRGVVPPRGTPVATAVIVDEDQTAQADRGAPRLIARAWSAPHADAAGALVSRLRLELAVQSARPTGPRGGLLDKPLTLGAEHDGTVYRHLTLEAALEPGFIYIITGEAPGTTWGVDAGEPAQALAPDIGPRVPRPPTIGEAMTISSTAGERTRALLVLVPRVPQR